MKQSLRKIFGTVSAVFLIGLFVTAAPVRAASTDERIKALAAELNQLKAEQQRVKQEQSQIREDALAARAKLPRFRYRSGSGLSVRAADRSWEWRVRGENSMYLTFFPNGGRSLEDDNDGGPTQGGMFKRHQQLGNIFRLRNGLYEFGLNIKCDRSGGDQCRESGGRMNVRFSTWSPYYPDLQVLDIRGDYSPLARVSSSSGHTVEREPSFTDFLSTGSSKGLGLHWSDVSAGMTNLAYFNIAYMSGGDQFNAPTDQDPLAQKGIFTQLGVEPFAKSKNKYLKGLTLGFSYVNVHDDDNREDGDNDQMRIRTRTRTNRATIFSMSTRGRHSYISPHVDYTVGPFNIGYTWSRNTGEQRRTGGCTAASDLEGSAEENVTLQERTGTSVVAGGAGEEILEDRSAAAASCNNFSDARITNNIIAGGVYVWGPKGFLSGSRNGGWRLSYTHNRIYIDAGSGFDADETENEFSAMRRWHYIENHIMLRWFQTRGLVWAILYEVNRVGKMKGSGRKPREARRRLNVLEDGGYYQAVSLHTKWIF